MGNLKETPWTEVMATLEALAHAGWTREDLKVLRSGFDIARGTLRMVRKEKAHSFELLVNYNRSVEDLIRGGEYDWANSGVSSKNFPIQRKGIRTVWAKLFRFNVAITSEEVIDEMRKEGYRPAELHELFAFGIEYPDEQRKYRIVALGSIRQNRSGLREAAACLYATNHGLARNLGLYGLNPNWEVCYRFLAVHEE